MRARVFERHSKRLTAAFHKAKPIRTWGHMSSCVDTVCRGRWCPAWAHVEWALTVGEQFNHSAANRIVSLTLCPRLCPSARFTPVEQLLAVFTESYLQCCGAEPNIFFHVNARQKSSPRSNLDPLESCTVWLKQAPGNRRRGFDCCVRRLPSRRTTHAASSDLLVGFGL